MKRNSWYPWKEKKQAVSTFKFPEKEMEEEDSQQQEVLTEEEKLEKKASGFLLRNTTARSQIQITITCRPAGMAKSLEWKTPYDNTGNSSCSYDYGGSFCYHCHDCQGRAECKGKKI